MQLGATVASPIIDQKNGSHVDYVTRSLSMILGAFGGGGFLGVI